MYVSAHRVKEEGKPLEIYVKADKAKKGRAKTFSSVSDLRAYLQKMADKLAGREHVDLSSSVQVWTGLPWRVCPKRKTA